MYVDGPWAEPELEQVSTKYESDWASFPIPSQNGPSPAPAFAGGSDLAVWVSSKYKTADWDLIKEMDSTSNATSFANLQGFFPAFTSQLKGGAYSGSQVMSGFAKAATVTNISPAEREELGHRGHHGSDLSHDDEIADAGSQLHRYR